MGDLSSVSLDEAVTMCDICLKSLLKRQHQWYKFVKRAIKAQNNM